MPTRRSVLVTVLALVPVVALGAVVVVRTADDDLLRSAGQAVAEAREVASLPAACDDVSGLGPGDVDLLGDPPHQVRARLRAQLQDRDGWQAVQHVGDLGVAVLWRHPVPADVLALDGTVVDEVPIRVVATRYGRAELQAGMRRIPLGQGPQDVNSISGACPDGAGVLVGVAEPPADTRGLERELSERAGVRVFVERFAGVMPA
ncbi:hypothetical protein GCM10023340_40020 [Nocardioides marinquilinus]|uniref:Flp pilus-assembly TadG-like N-terminal domain-containing protein n=1 Tax=Nocardioides marinquilinus TaxID=1210400 RepID=A0ABP9Q1F8_9ACTN